MEGGDSRGDATRVALLVCSLICGMLLASNRLEAERRTGWWLGIPGRKAHTEYDTENLTRTMARIARERDEEKYGKGWR